MLEIEECLSRLLNEVQPQNRIEKVPITECQGMVLGEDVTAEMMVPPYPKSAMDGYALRAADIAGAAKEHPVKLKVLGELLAGDYQEYPEYSKCPEHTKHPENFEYPEHSKHPENSEHPENFGEERNISHQLPPAVRVMTGSYIPRGFDAVIRQEDTDYGEDEVTVYAPVGPYANYCKVGEDIKKGDLVIPKYTRLSPLHIGLLASLGAGEVFVCVPARIAIISTGTELAEVGSPLSPGKIYNSIAYMLAAAVRREGLSVSSMETCMDDEELLQDRISRAVGDADMVITTGAVSVGKKDIIPKVLEAMGARRLFQGADIQPGTPTLASVLNGKVVLSLSGNPYAAIANFEFYFWPAAAKMMHSAGFEVKTASAELASEYAKVNRLRRMVRAYAGDGKVTIPSEVHASSVIHNLTECNCFIDLEAGRAVKPGDRVRIRYFKGGDGI